MHFGALHSIYVQKTGSFFSVCIIRRKVYLFQQDFWYLTQILLLKCCRSFITFLLVDTLKSWPHPKNFWISLFILRYIVGKAVNSFQLPGIRTSHKIRFLIPHHGVGVATVWTALKHGGVHTWQLLAGRRRICLTELGPYKPLAAWWRVVNLSNYTTMEMKSLNHGF